MSVASDRSMAREASVVREAYDLGPRAKALLRGREIIARDLRAADGAFDMGQVRTLLGISKQAVSRRVDEGTLLAVPGPSGQRRYPAAQFVADGVVPGLKQVLEALPSRSPWFHLNFLVNPSPVLDGHRPFDLLRQGQAEQVVEAAARVGEQGA